jgi:hypothetical protein
MNVPSIGNGHDQVTGSTVCVAIRFHMIEKCFENRSHGVYSPVQKDESMYIITDKSRSTTMEIMYKQKAEPGKQCQDCQSFTPNSANPAAGTCFGKDVVAEGGCMFFKKKEEEQK